MTVQNCFVKNQLSFTNVKISETFRRLFSSGKPNLNKILQLGYINLKIYSTVRSTFWSKIFLVLHPNLFLLANRLISDNEKDDYEVIK